MSGGSGYLDFLQRLVDLGLIIRESGYRPGQESKTLTLIWEYDHAAEPYKIDGRVPGSYDEALLHAYSEGEYLQALRRSGIDPKVIAALRRSLAKREETILETCN
jgi:hypothetical protein